MAGFPSLLQNNDTYIHISEYWTERVSYIFIIV